MIKEQRLIDFARVNLSNIMTFWFKPTIIIPDQIVESAKEKFKLQTFYSGSCPSVKDAKDSVEMMLVMQALFGVENVIEAPFGLKEYSFGGLSQFLGSIPENFETVWNDYFLFRKQKVECYTLQSFNMKLKHWPIDQGPWSLTHICALKFSL